MSRRIRPRKRQRLSARRSHTNVERAASSSSGSEDTGCKHTPRRAFLRLEDMQERNRTHNSGQVKSIERLSESSQSVATRGELLARLTLKDAEVTLLRQRLAYIERELGLSPFDATSEDAVAYYDRAYNAVRPYDHGDSNGGADDE